LAARQDRLDKYVDGAFAVAMAGIAWLAVFGHRGVAPMVGLIALAAAFRKDIWISGITLLSPPRLRCDPLGLAALSMIGFSAWVSVSALWSPTPGGFWLGMTILVAVFGAGALVFEAAHATPKRAQRFSALFVLMVVSASAALLFEGLSGGYLRAVIPPDDLTPLRWKDMTALARGVTVMAPLVFPAAVLIRRITGSWAIALVPASAAFVAAMQFSVFANVLAIGAGAAAFGLALVRPRLCLVVLAILLMLALISAPFVAAAIPAEAIVDGGVGVVPASWGQRLFVWKETGVRVLRDCMPLGCGADYARSLKESAGMIVVKGSAITLPAMPLHPHNLFLQIWLELGLPGVAAFGAAIAAAAAALMRAKIDAGTLAAAGAVIAVSFISVMFEASLWQIWRLAVFTLAALGCAVSYSVNNSS
jgi:O-antigen ligase